MDSNEASWRSSIASANNSWQWKNNTGKINPIAIYVFTPAGVNAKRVLCLILTVIGVVGFLGNALIFFFLWKKKSRPRSLIQSNPFAKNLKAYVKSLSLSDLLCCAVSLPLVCIQIFFDIFQSSWPCKMVRYINFIFPVITVNNLVVISLEKYLSTRPVPRTFSFSVVRKMIICAWIFGLVVSLFPLAAYDRIRVDLNNTHFTIVCRYDKNFYSLGTDLTLFSIYFALPGIFIACINTCLLKTVWTRTRGQIGSVRSFGSMAQRRAQRIKGTSFLAARSFAFIFSYFFYIGNIVYTAIEKPQRDFSTDYLIRHYTAGVAYCNSVFNFFIYFTQMKKFRVFLYNVFCRSMRGRIKR